MVDERAYRTLRNIAIVMVVGWVGWSVYDGFLRARGAEAIALEAAHKAYADGHYADARAGYREVLEQQPSSLDARRGLARSLMELGRHQAALTHFDRAIEAAPGFGATYANRGILHDRMGHYEEAIDDYRKALELDPSLADGPGWLTRFLRNQPEAPPTIDERAAYLAAQLQLPPGERLLRVPEADARQRSYRREQ